MRMTQMLQIGPGRTGQADPATAVIRFGIRASGSLLLLLVLLMTMLPGSLAQAQSESTAEDQVEFDQAQLEAQLESARQALDEAARQLAELNMKKFKVETDGPKADRPMLGVLIEEYNSGDGIKLVGVTPNGGAARAGLKAGDRLVAVNGHRLDEGDNSQRDLHEAMASVEAGDTVTVEYMRDGGLLVADLETKARREFAAEMMGDIDIDIDLSELESLKELHNLQGLGKIEALQALEGLESLEGLVDLKELRGLVSVNAIHGLKLEDVEGDLAGYFGVDEGVVVMSAPDDSELKAGDVLLSLSGEEVQSAWQVIAALQSAEAPLEVEILRQKQQQTVQVDENIAIGPEVIRIRSHHSSAAEEAEEPAP